jgi:phosphatidate phosphatase APP1
MYQRFESDEIPYASLRITYGDILSEITCDEEGYFETFLEPLTPIQSDDLWAVAELELIDPPPGLFTPCKAQGKILIPPSSSEYGVISDIDDTIVQTGTLNLIPILRALLFEDANERQPLPGFSSFYCALYKGSTGGSRNPLFYVSSSPWNLYDLLFDFIKLQNIPLDPVLLLRDYGISKQEILPTLHHEHKLKYIQVILDMYPDLPFILIGDNGQDDPEIYALVDRQNPGRIKAIYIREIDKSSDRVNAVKCLLDQVPVTYEKTIITDDSIQMASHARRRGWITGTSNRVDV